MPDEKISEFRERAQAAVAAPDPGALLRRGQSLRRRRQLAPVAAVAALAVIGVGFLEIGDRDARTDPPPAGRPTPTATAGPDVFTLDSIGDDDGRPDATANLVGPFWGTWHGGAYIADSDGAVSWGFQPYEDTIIESCHPERHATSRPAAIAQLSHVPGRVTRAARPADKLGLTGTYLQVSVPITVDCQDGTTGNGSLMASWDGPEDPTVTVDVWLLEDGDRLLILTRGVRGHPSPADLANLDQTLDSLEYLPTT
jgi:hypothetical protein